MPRACPECRHEMQSDGIHEWCPSADCTVTGYVVARTGKIVRDDDQRGRYERDGSRRGVNLKR